MGVEERRTGRLSEAVGRKAERRRRSRSRPDTNLWSGLGSVGVVGWSVAVPMLVGVAVGIWLDRATGGPVPWTVVLLVVGAVLGCLNAWHWIARSPATDHDEEDSS